MKIIKYETNEYIFPFIAYIPEKTSESPALLIQLHGAGERGNGGTDTTANAYPKFQAIT